MIDPTVVLLVSKLRTADPQTLNLRQVECLAEAVYFETKSEPLLAQIGVASVVLNRGRPCVVIREPKQFSCRSRKSLKRNNQEAWVQAVEVAVLTASGQIPKMPATHFTDTSVKPKWSRKMKYLGKIGKLKFWRNNA